MDQIIPGLLGALKEVLVDSNVVWLVAGAFIIKIVDWLYGFYKNKKDNPWVDLVADLAETAYFWVEEHSMLKGYPKMGEFMKKFAEEWFKKTGRQPDPDAQGAAAMIAANVAKADKLGSDVPKA